MKCTNKSPVFCMHLWFHEKHLTFQMHKLFFVEENVSLDIKKRRKKGYYSLKCYFLNPK